MLRLVSNIQIQGHNLGFIMKEIALRHHQKKGIDLIRESFRKGNRKVILQAPCSYGKTRVAAKIIQSIISNGKRVYFICDRITLIDQAVEAFDAFDIPLGVIQAQHERTNYAKPLQVCSIQSLANRRNLPHADVIIYDEAHGVNKALTQLMEKWDNVKFIGLTATAYTNGLGLIWDDLVIGARITELLKSGYLVPLIEYGTPIGCDLHKIKTQIGDYNQKELGKVVNKVKIVGDIVKNWKVLGKDRQTLCFAVNIAHSKHIVDQFNLHGIVAAHIDCFTKSNDRHEIYNKFKNKEIRIISSVDILVKGFDSPIASCLIMARPTKSLIVYVQTLGRGQRLHDGKKDCIVLDCGGNVERHGFITDQLPEILSCTKKTDSIGSKKKESLPKPCSKCFFMKPAKVHKCPQCGYAPIKQNEVENTNDSLVKINKIDSSIKKEWYAMLLYHARIKHYSDGQASHSYKEKFGVWPSKKIGVCPIPPNEEVRKYIKYLIIKKARSKYGNNN